MKQIPAKIYDFIPNLKIPKSFWGNLPERPCCIYLATCIEKGTLYINKSLIDITGHNSALMFEGGLDWWFSLIHPDDLPPMLNEIFQHCFLLPPNKRLNKPFFSEYRLRNAQNEYIWIRESKCVVSLTPDGTNEYIIGRFEDVSDIKKDAANQFSEIFKQCTIKNPLLAAAFPVLENAAGNISKNAEPEPAAMAAQALNKFTRRELEVLKLISEGYSTKIIADKLFISINTVETHRRHLLEKTQVKNSMELVRQATHAFWLKAS